MKITPQNYYSKEANQAYFTASQIKTYQTCPSQWLAAHYGEYERPASDALFHGSYVDVALTEPDKLDQFVMDHGAEIYGRSYGGKSPKKLAAIQDLDKAIARVKKDEYFMSRLEGESQVIIVLDDFHGHPYKCMLDNLSFEGAFLTDLKTCKDLYGEEWVTLDDGSFRKVHWIAYWRYILQLALYREAVFQEFGFRPHPYIAAIQKPTKYKPCDFDVFDLMSEQTKSVKAKEIMQSEVASAVRCMDEMATMKGDDPREVKMCGRCPWCVSQKTLTGPRNFDYEPVMFDF